MKIDITEKKDKPLLARQEIVGVVTFDKATPSNDDFAAAIAKQLNVALDTVMIKKIDTRFGESKADFFVCVYHSKKDLDYFEPKPTKWLEKMKKKEEAIKAKEAEAAKEEAPKEEPVKEEAPKEEVKEGA